MLFCSGAVLSGSLDFGIVHLEALGLRLMAFGRPGLGDSDPHPQKTLQSFSDDVREVVAREHLLSPSCGTDGSIPARCTPHDFGTTLASRLPDSTHSIDDEEGGSILWTRSGTILEQLLARG